MAKHRYVIEGQSFDVEVLARSGSGAEVTVNGKQYRVERADVTPPVAAPAPGGASGIRPRRAAPVAGEIRAPMAGLVLRVDVTPGQRIDAGTPVVLLDAMKMENSIRAPHAGIVREIPIVAGQSVLTGALLARVEEK